MTGVFRTPEAGREVLSRYRAALARWPVPSEQRVLPTCEGETFVLSCGPEDAPPVVLLHGSAFNSLTWIGDAPSWSRRLRLHAVDIVGEPGLSAPSRPPLGTEASALWLGDVLSGLGLQRAAFVGLSLGGLLAADYAVRRPGRVSALVLISPGGIGRHRDIVWWALPLALMGPWGRRRLAEAIMGPQPPPEALTEEQRWMAGFMALIHRSFRPRTARLPQIADAGLAALDLPVLAVLGGRDVFIDSAGARARIERQVKGAEVLWLPDHRHGIVDQGGPILAFLERALTGTPRP